MTLLSFKRRSEVAAILLNITGIIDKLKENGIK
jgi:hypothetical protein